jgi:hypothetical protein
MHMKRFLWFLASTVGVVVVTIACVPSVLPAAAESVSFEVQVTQAEPEAKTAPTATPAPPDEHWLAEHGEVIFLRCGGDRKVESIPAGQLDIDLNGVDSLAFGCAPWEGGANAAASPAEVKQHWQLAHGQTGYALCGGTPLDGQPAGQWEAKVNGVDSVELTCSPWEGGK